MDCSLVGRVPAAPPDSCSFQKPPDGWEDTFPPNKAWKALRFVVATVNQANTVDHFCRCGVLLLFPLVPLVPIAAHSVAVPPVIPHQLTEESVYFPCSLKN
jgi:hypothetical protein